MMSARFFLLVFLVSGASCSSQQEPAATLRVIWKVGSPDQDASASADLGGIDDRGFYVMRGRRNDVRQLVAYRREDGSEFLRADVQGFCEPPVVAAGRLFCPGARLYAFDLSNGRALWSVESSDRLDPVEGTADASRVYAGTSDFNGRTTEAFAADAATGQIRWRRTFTGEGWSGARLRSLTLSPEGDLLAALLAQFGASGAGGEVATVVALDPATGEERWRYQGGGAGTFGDIGGLTIWEDLVLYNDSGGGMAAVAFNRTTRAVVWRAPWTPTYAGTLRAPLVADGVAYFADGFGTTFAVDARTGVQRWRTNRPGNARSLEVCGPVVLMNNGPVEVLDRATGRPRGRLLADDDTADETAVADGVVYVSATSGVYAFDCTS